jgi:hypothetical protein
MNDDQARDLILAIRELSARLDYWGEETRKRLTDVLRAENHGWRVRNYVARSNLMRSEEWEQGKKAIVERLQIAPTGMLKEEIKQFLVDAAHKRVAGSILSSRNDVCPLAQLVKEQRVFVSSEPARKNNVGSGFKRYRYWSREHYLRNYAQFSDDQQRDLVEAAIAEAKQEK